MLLRTAYGPAHSLSPRRFIGEVTPDERDALLAGEAVAFTVENDPTVNAGRLYSISECPVFEGGNFMVVLERV